MERRPRDGSWWSGELAFEPRQTADVKRADLDRDTPCQASNAQPKWSDGSIKALYSIVTHKYVYLTAYSQDVV